MDEFRLGVGAGGMSLALAVLHTPISGQSGIRLPGGSNVGTSTLQRGRGGEGDCAQSGGSGGSGTLGSEVGRGFLLVGRLLRHLKTLEETDGER